ncbi:prolipoprotein diacylglyceryl transferase [Candidatus Poribacteria bacterium]|nr:prolipoprotein diacylglyceryl transferase [Candidatus Poribacteria bacterium]
MYPILLKLGPFAIYTYGLFVAIGFLCAIMLSIKLGEKEQISEDTIMSLCLWILVFSIAGARIFYVIQNISYYADNPLEIIQVYKGGLVFYGGFIGGTLIAIWYTNKHKLSLWNISDILAPGIAIGEGIGRIGCLFRGCCFGKETTLPWAITFPHDSLASWAYGDDHHIHPTQIYASLLNIIIFIFLYFYFKKRKFHGQIFLLYVMLYAVARSFVETLRGDEERGFMGYLSTSQWIGSGFFIIGIIMYIYLQKKQRLTTDTQR